MGPCVPVPIQEETEHPRVLGILRHRLYLNRACVSGTSLTTVTKYQLEATSRRSFVFVPGSGDTVHHRWEGMEVRLVHSRRNFWSGQEAELGGNPQTLPLKDLITRPHVPKILTPHKQFYLLGVRCSDTRAWRDSDIQALTHICHGSSSSGQ